MKGFPRGIIIIYVLTPLILGSGAAWAYLSQESSLRSQSEEQLEAIGQLKANQIIVWREERLADAERITNDPALNRAISEWAKQPETPFPFDTLQTLNAIQKAGHYSLLLVVGRDGRQVKDFSDPPISISTEENADIRTGIQAGSPFLTDLFLDTTEKSPFIDLVAPIAGRGWSGAVVLRIDAAHFLFPMIQAWPNSSAQSGETLLVRRDGQDVLYLNELRFMKNAALTLRIPLTQTEVPAVRAVLGEQGVLEGLDYRGVPVLSAVHSIKGSPWFIVAKIDQDEALSNWRVRSFLILSLVAVTFLALSISFFAIWQRRQSEYYKSLSVEQVARVISESRLSAALMSISDGVIATDDQGRVEMLNPEAERMTGWTQNEARTRPLTEVFHIINEISRETVEDPTQIVLRKGTTVRLFNHTLLLHRDGSEFPVADSCAPICDNSGKITGVILVFRDQSSERTAQKALQDSEASYRRLFEAARDGILILDFETGLITDANPFLVEMLGYSREQFLGRRLWELGLFKDIVANQDNFTELQKKEFIRHKDMPLETAKGNRLEVEFVSNVYLVDHHKVVQCNIRDITDRKKVELALRQSEERYRRIADAVTDYIYSVRVENGQAAETVHGAGCEAITGYRPEEFKSDPLLWLWMVPEEDREKVQVHAERILTTGESEELEHRIIRKDGIIRWVRNTQAPRFDSDQQLIAYDGLITDVTERRQAEEEVNQQFENFFRKHDAIFLLMKGKDGQLVDANDAALRFYGYTLQQIRTMNIGDINQLAPEELERERERAVRQERTFFIMPHRIANGDIRAVEVHSTPVTIKNEVFLFSVIHDSTERKQMEHTLSNERATLEAAFEQTPLPMVLVSMPDGIIRIANSASIEVLGVKDEPNPQGQKLSEYKPTYQDFDLLGNRTPLTEAPLARAIHGQRTINEERRIVTKDGTAHWTLVSGSPIYNAMGELIAAYLVFPEITERKVAEEALQFTQFAVDHMADATLWMTKEDGRIMYVNQAASQLLGYSLEEFHTLTAFDIDPTVTFAEWQKNFEVSQSRGSIHFESSYRMKTGEMIPVEVTANYVEFGGRVFNCALIRNISDRKKTEAALVQQLDELMTWQKVTIGRENRILELKKEINKLLIESGKPPRYQDGS
jgi:PAS domain S-box-containing protein